MGLCPESAGPPSGTLEYRTLIQADLDGVIGEPATVLQAELDVYAYTSAPDIDFYPVTSPWSSGSVTWNQASSGTAWSNAGGDFDSGALWHNASGPSASWRWGYLSGTVQRWLDGTTANNGVMIRHAGSGTVQLGSYRSREYHDSSVRAAVLDRVAAGAGDA